MPANDEKHILVEKFKVEFHRKFGIVPEVYIPDGTTFTKKISLPDLIAIADSMLESPAKFPLGIRTRTRKREIVLLRQCVCRIGRQMKYSLNTIGYHLGGIDHATVLHGCKTVENLIQSRDMHTISTLSALENGIKDKFGIDGDVQPDPEERVNSQSILPDVLHEGGGFTAPHQHAPGAPDTSDRRMDHGRDEGE